MVAFEKVYLYTNNNGESFMTYNEQNFTLPYSVINVVPTGDGEIDKIVASYYSSDNTVESFTYNKPNFFNTLLTPGETLLVKLQNVFLNLSEDNRRLILESPIYLGSTELQKFINFFSTHAGTTLFLYSLLNKSSSAFDPIVTYLPASNDLSDISGASRRLANYYFPVLSSSGNELAKAWIEQANDFWDIFGSGFPEGPVEESDLMEVIFRATSTSALITRNNLAESQKAIAALQTNVDNSIAAMNNNFIQMRDKFNEGIRQAEIRMNSNAGQVLSLTAKTVSYALSGLNDRRNEIVENVNTIRQGTINEIENKKDEAEKRMSELLSSSKSEVNEMNSLIDSWNISTKMKLEELANDIEKRTIHCGIAAANTIYKELKTKSKEDKQKNKNGRT